MGDTNRIPAILLLRLRPNVMPHRQAHGSSQHELFPLKTCSKGLEQRVYGNYIIEHHYRISHQLLELPTLI